MNVRPFSGFSPEMEAYANSIKGIESSGRYGIVGPSHPRYGRALGAYQIMEANLPEWSRAALGREVSAGEFLATPEIQDAIFNNRFGGYVDKYGNPQDAASAWLTGRPQSKGGNSADAFGTTGNAYVAKFNAGLNGDTQNMAYANSQNDPRNPAAAAIDQQTTGSTLPTSLPDSFPTDAKKKGGGLFGEGGFFDMTDPRMLIAMQLIMNGQRPPGQGFDGIPELVAYSAKMNERKEEKAKEALQRNQTYQTLRNKAPDLAEAMLGGLPAPDAYNLWAKRLADQNDPAYQLDMQYKRAQLDALNKKPQRNWQRFNDTTLFDPESGETKAIGSANANGAFRFAGNSVEAQALNGLMESGKITEEQAQQLGAGKTITGENGEIIFMTPQGVFSQQGSQSPQPIGGVPEGGGIDIFGDGSAPPAASPAPAPMPGPAPEAGQPQRPGLIKLTEPKVTIDERKAAGFSDRMGEAEDVLAQVGSAGTGVWDNFVRNNNWIPDVAENWLVSGDFQKYEQARRNFINAQMRRESGAVISPEEFLNADKQYFPQPGDTADVIEQKRRNRQIALASMGRDAGPTYKAARPEGGKPSSSGQPRTNDYKTRYGLE